MDLNKLGTLLHIADLAHQHGPRFGEITGFIDRELVKMNDELKGEREKEQRKVVTPAAGPANSAVENPDGSITPIAPVKNPVDNDQRDRPLGQRHQPEHPAINPGKPPIYPPDANRPQVPTNPREPFHPANPDADVERRV